MSLTNCDDKLIIGIIIIIRTLYYIILNNIP